MRRHFTRKAFLAGGMLLIAAGPHLMAAPVVYYGGILNSASYGLQGMPNGSIARGSIFAIFGTGLGPSTATQQPSYPLKANLGGVSIEVRQGTSKFSAIPLIVSAGQINAVMPSNAPLGDVGISVTYNGETSNYSSATVVPASFGTFAVSQVGSGPGVVQNVNSGTDRPINSLREPAQRGQTLIVWGTGLGAVPDDTVPPSAGDLPGQVDVIIGGKVTPASYKGRSPCCSGVDQIVTRIPDDAPLGCFVPLQVRVSGAVLSNSVSIAISDGAAACSDPQTPVQNLLSKGGRNGLVLLSHLSLRDDISSSTSMDNAADQIAAAFVRQPGGDFAFNPLLSLPPVGTCTGYSTKGGGSALNAFSQLLQFPSLGSELDAGAKLTVETVNVFRRAGIPLYYAANLGEQDTPTLPGILNPGNTVTISGPGGADIGAFTTKVPAPPAFDFKERTSLWNVPRQNPLTLSWTPTTGTALIMGYNYLQSANATAGFICTAAATDGAFTIPSYVLGSLPVSPAILGRSDGLLMVGLVRPLGSFTAPSLDSGVVVGLSASAKSVVFR